MADADKPKSTSLNDLDIPALEGYVLLADAADILKVTRQHVYRLVRDNALKSVRRIGTSNFYVVKVTEVEERRDALAERREAREAAAKSA